MDEDRAEEVVLSDGTGMCGLLDVSVQSTGACSYAIWAACGVCITAGVLVETCLSG